MENNCCLGQVSGLVPEAARHLPGGRGRGRGAERVEDAAGAGGWWVVATRQDRVKVGPFDANTVLLQLDQTQKLVQQLSSQLADLRDQMTEQRKHKQRMGGCRICAKSLQSLCRF